MPTLCTKIKLRKGSADRVTQWAAELNRRAEEVREVLRSEGVSLEAAFLDTQADGVYIVYVMHSHDFEKAKAVATQSVAAIDAFHQGFKRDCWENTCKLETLIDFAL